MIQLISTEIGYNSSPILEPFDLTIGENEFWGVIGSNGGGKTTLIKTILGLIPAISGEIIYSPDSHFGYVPQRKGFDTLFPISVFELVLMGRYGKAGFGKSITTEDKEIALDCLKQVGISDLAQRTFRSLSGGEVQRALIARALAARPSVLVLDEPTASVDIKGESEIMELVNSIKAQNKLTVIMVSHFVATVAEYADHMILIDKQSAIFKKGSTQDIMNSDAIQRVFGINVSAGNRRRDN